MLEAERISFRYKKGQRWVLKDLSIRVRRGEIVGLRGVSGQGKTTLARILAGYLRPNAGSVTLDGSSLPPKGYSPVQLVFQLPEMAVNPRWRIRHVLAEGRSDVKRSVAMLALDASLLDRYPYELSGGELQRVALARVLSPKTRYLIADEITTMLDAVTQAQIWRLLQDHVARHRMGLLAISHDTVLLDCICDQVIDMAEINRTAIT